MPTFESHRHRQALLVFLGIASLSAAACVPHVSHGPRIQEGNRWFVNAGVTHAQGLQNENASLLPTMYAGGARGWAKDDNGPAFSLGLQLPVYLLPAVIESASSRWFLGASFLDLYVQPRRAAPGGLDYGAGALLSADVAMPYVQLGRAGDGGFYTTQAFATTYNALAHVHYWIPEIAFRSERPDGTQGVDFYLSGAVGDGGANHGTEWFFSAGVVADISRGH
jgi:hypothetical protein